MQSTVVDNKDSQKHRKMDLDVPIAALVVYSDQHVVGRYQILAFLHARMWYANVKRDEGLYRITSFMVNNARSVLYQVEGAAGKAEKPPFGIGSGWCQTWTPGVRGDPNPGSKGMEEEEEEEAFDYSLNFPTFD